LLLATITPGINISVTVLQSLKCKIRGPLYVVWGPLHYMEPLNLITALYECTIKKEDAVMLGKKISR